jgi:hypothetical protein
MSTFAHDLWVRLPRRVARRFPGLGMVMTDGYTLVGLGDVAGLLPLLALAGGLLVGAIHLGFETAVTESLPIMLGFLAVGFLSSQLAVWGVTGFAVGDFFVNHSDWAVDLSSYDPLPQLSNPVVANLAVVRVPLLIEYLLLAALALGVPVTARVLTASLTMLVRLPDLIGVVVNGTLMAAIGFVSARFWVGIAPIVVLPMFKWEPDGLGGRAPAEAISTLQENEPWFAGVAVVAAIVRVVSIWALSRARPDTIEQAERDLLAPLDPRTTREPGVVSTIARTMVGALIGVLFLAGMIDELHVAGVLFAVFVGSGLLRSGVLGLPPRHWRELVNKVPLALRVAAQVVVMTVIGQAMLGSDVFENETLQVFVWPVAVATVLAALLLPLPPVSPVEPAPAAPHQEAAA